MGHEHNEIAAQRYIGIDLGTTNSAIAVFEAGAVRMLANASGDLLTPSAVHVNAEGQASCGHQALAAARTDPANVCTEHKRLMGGDTGHRFPASRRSLDPVALAQIVLQSTVSDYVRHYGDNPQGAVISIPASFSLPQCEATARAAADAGLSRVELVQEPIAAALAAGWTPSDGEGHWLVYDLGGGTFDVSLLEADAGFLRVLDHAGDPFLGGRDIDAAIARWACSQVGLRPADLEPAQWAALRRSAQALKVRMSDVQGGTDLHFDDCALEGPQGRVDALSVNAELLCKLVDPFVRRSVRIIERLLQANKLDARALKRVLLVGGPTRSRALRELVSRGLGVPVHHCAQPMLAVAKGAALFAAASQVQAQSPALAPLTPDEAMGCPLWMHHPPVTADLKPDVVGRYIGAGAIPALVIATAPDGRRYESSVDHTGAFRLSLELTRESNNVFALAVVDETGEMQLAHPSELTIMHGLTIDEPPLGSSVGVALADNRVQVYFERGTPLPARRTFVHKTVEHVSGATDVALTVPIVQGEYDRAHLCQAIGFLELRLHDAKLRLPAGSEIEVVLELDRSGRLRAQARLPGGLGLREQVAHLLVPAAAPQALREGVERLRERISQMRQSAFRARDPQRLEQLAALEARVQEIADITAEAQVDPDAVRRARPLALELEAELEREQDAHQMGRLETQALTTMTWANTWVSLRGSPRERAMLESHAVAIDSARDRLDPVELQRHTRLVAQLGESAWLRDPRSWGQLFETICADVDRATDLPRAYALMDRGRDALAREDWGGVRSIVERLRPLLPARATTRRMAHGSGVR